MGRAGQRESGTAGERDSGRAGQRNSVSLSGVEARWDSGTAVARHSKAVSHRSASGGRGATDYCQTIRRSSSLCDLIERCATSTRVPTGATGGRPPPAQSHTGGRPPPHNHTRAVARPRTITHVPSANTPTPCNTDAVTRHRTFGEVRAGLSSRSPARSYGVATVGCATQQ